MNIGYLGLGNMGGALARRLQLARPLHVYDLDAAALQSLTEAGAVACASPAELASRCDVVMICLPTSDHVRNAIFGPGGLADALRPGALIIDQTTGDPITTRVMAAELDLRGVGWVDAPVSGGAQGAQAGTIAIMVGAEPAAFERARPILSDISPNLFHAGGVGAGHVIKLVNNVLSGAQRLLSLEAVALAAKNGIEPQTACEILLAGGARNAFIEKFLAPHIIKGQITTGFTLGLMHKDMRLACQLGNDSGVPMFFGNIAREMYQLCISEMGRDADVHSAALVMDRLAGSNIVPKGSAA